MDAKKMMQQASVASQAQRRLSEDIAHHTVTEAVAPLIIRIEKLEALVEALTARDRSRSPAEPPT